MKRTFLLIFLVIMTAQADELKLESTPRLDTKSAIKILAAAQDESLKQKVDVAIIIVGNDGRILASSKSEKMGPQLYQFAIHKAQTSWFKGMHTEELPARNGQGMEMVNLGDMKVIRGVKGGVPLYYKGHVVGAIGVSGTHPDIDKLIAEKGLAAVKGLSAKK